MNRGSLAKQISRTLQGADLVGSAEPVIVFLAEPRTKHNRIEGWLIQVGEPIHTKGERAPPRVIRGVLWDLRNAEFLDREGACMWSVYDPEYEMVYSGVGLVTADETLATQAEAQGLIVQGGI